MAGEDQWERVVKRPEECCADCGERFVPGAEMVTALEFSDAGFLRVDCCLACFEGREVEPFSFWRVQRSRSHNRPRRLDFKYLSELFRRLEGRSDDHSRRLAWLVTLLLLRRKALVEVGRTLEDGVETLQVSFKGDERVLKVRDPGLDSEAMASLHEDLARIFNLEEPEVREEGSPTP